MSIALPATRRVLFVGMNNPRAGEPLWPRPHNTAGHRLYRLIREATGWEMDDYIARTERVNFVDGQAWSYDAARKRLDHVRAMASGRRCIAVGIPAATLLEAPHGDGQWFTWDGAIAAMPHTSPFNRWWNDNANWGATVGFLKEALQ